MKPVFFDSAKSFRDWLEKNHRSEKELWVGFYNKASKRSGIRYAEALDEALCYGWIDGIRRRVDENGYTNRFTPRKARSIWSIANIRHVERLTGEGRMCAPGLAAFAARTPERTGIYASENRTEKLSAKQLTLFRAHKKAWAFFSQQPPGYRRNAIHKVVSPKQAATRDRWLQRLIADSAQGRRLSVLVSPSKQKPLPKRR